MKDLHGYSYIMISWFCLQKFIVCEFSIQMKAIVSVENFSNPQQQLMGNFSNQTADPTPKSKPHFKDITETMKKGIDLRELVSSLSRRVSNTDKLTKNYKHESPDHYVLRTEGKETKTIREKQREGHKKGSSKDSKEIALLRKSISSTPIVVQQRDNLPAAKGNQKNLKSKQVQNRLRWAIIQDKFKQLKQKTLEGISTLNACSGQKNTNGFTVETPQQSLISENSHKTHPMMSDFNKRENQLKVRESELKNWQERLLKEELAIQTKTQQLALLTKDIQDWEIKKKNEVLQIEGNLMKRRMILQQREKNLEVLEQKMKEEKERLSEGEMELMNKRKSMQILDDKFNSSLQQLKQREKITTHKLRTYAQILIEKEALLNRKQREFQPMHFQRRARPGPGLTQDEIRGIRTVLNQQTETQTCGICVLQYFEYDQLAELNCGHRFHPQCIKPWMRMNSKCPYCRLDQRED